MDLRKRIREEEVRRHKKSKSRKWVTALFAIMLTTVITTIAVDATDNLGNLSRSLVGSALNSVLDGEESGPCPSGMVFVSASSGGFCIDAFESSPSEECIFSDPRNQNESATNLENRLCKAVSLENKEPWRNIARHQAEAACANAGKHLPTNAEWYAASLGTPDTDLSVSRGDCNVFGLGRIAESGSFDRCVSSFGAYDMVGNAWEWVSETVIDGSFNGRVLPEEGYVASIDSAGVPLETRSAPDQAFNKDYVWIDKAGARGMIRGGYFGNETDAGMFAINAITPPTFTGDAVGFRCAL